MRTLIKFIYWLGNLMPRFRKKKKYVGGQADDIYPHF